MGGGTAYLTVALGILAAALLWFGLWPLGAVALAFLVGGRREPATLAADAIVFVGLAGHADPLWVALLVVASLAASSRDFSPSSRWSAPPLRCGGWSGRPRRSDAVFHVDQSADTV